MFIYLLIKYYLLPSPYYVQLFGQKSLQKSPRQGIFWAKQWDLKALKKQLYNAISTPR